MTTIAAMEQRRLRAHYELGVLMDEERRRPLQGYELRMLRKLTLLIDEMDDKLGAALAGVSGASHSP